VSKCVTVPNFFEIARTVTEICERKFGLKMPIHAPFWGVLGASYALMQEMPCLSFMLLLLDYYCKHYAISARRYLNL